jgi:hypothetical protein
VITLAAQPAKKGAFEYVVSQEHAHEKTSIGRRPSLGHRGQFRSHQKRTRPRSQQNSLLAWLAPSRFAGHARLRNDGRHPASRQYHIAAQKNDAPSPSGKTSFLIRWSIQEIRRIAIRLAQRRIQPAHIIAWSLWRRTHQAEARRAHLKTKMQL